MGERKMKIIDVSRATGIHRNMITLLYRESATRVDMDAMNKLCAFFHVGVADLFEYVPDDADGT